MAKAASGMSSFFNIKRYFTSLNTATSCSREIKVDSSWIEIETEVSSNEHCISKGPKETDCYFLHFWKPKLIDYYIIIILLEQLSPRMPQEIYLILRNHKTQKILISVDHVYARASSFVSKIRTFYVLHIFLGRHEGTGSTRYFLVSACTCTGVATRSLLPPESSTRCLSYHFFPVLFWSWKCLHKLILYCKAYSW